MNTTTLLQNLYDQTNLILLETKSVFSDASENTLNARPDAIGWSALECLEHLNRYNGYYLKAIGEAIQKSQMAVKDQEVRSTWIGKKSIAMMHPSNRKRQKTFKRMNPLNSTLTITTLDQFIKDQEQLLTLLKQASTSDVNAKAVSVEFFKMLKMTIVEAFEFIIVHEQRHLIQAREALPKSQTVR